MAKYAMYLSYNNEQEAIQLPVLPESIEITESGSNKTYDIIGLGEINVLKNIKLSEIGFESIFPAAKGSFVTASKFQEPQHYINTLKKWMEAKTPVRFIFTGSTVDINMMVSIEKFTWKESGGAVGDIEYQLGLKKYVAYAAKKVVVTTPQGATTPVLSAPAQPARQNTKPVQKTYTLVAGDSLWKVAQKLLGNGARWGEIQKLNNIPDSKLRSLPIGLTLKIPG